MPYTITATQTSTTIAGAECEIDDPVRAYATIEESSTYELHFGNSASAYVITSQDCQD